MIIMPGMIAIYGALPKTPCARFNILPHEDMGCWTPSPRKLSDDSIIMAFATPVVAAMMMVGKTAGNK
jgi:hypothetical protein